ncbi:MAG TPA: ISNCY family transposase [Geminicoccaceae bacterium]|nr:ISNCY family transposase [Geminicoccaceae bacterium]
MRYRYDNRHTVTTLTGLVRLRLQIRRCENPACTRHHQPYRPEAEGAIVLPQHQFGLDVIALIGAWRYREHRSVPEIHRGLRERGVAIAERTVTHLLDRYDELVATTLTDDDRLRGVLARQGRVILALDGLQPDVGHEVLWVLRDCLSGEVLLARSLLSATSADLAELLREVAAGSGVPIVGVISDGQRSVRLAVEQALPGVPHQLCQFHYLREAGHPVFEADRHAKKELKKQVRGVRPLERAVEGRDDPEAEAVRGYCAAVRSAITDDGRPPLAASGLQLQGRLEQVAASLDRVGRKGGLSRPLQRLRQLLARGLERTRSLWPPIRRAYAWVHQAARILENAAGEPAAMVRRRLDGLLGAMARHRAKAGPLAEAVEHFRKVSRSYRPGLFHCYAVADLPRTNNGLEQLFGSYRRHERRATGRKTASSATVLRGPVRIIAAVATRLRRQDAGDLAGVDRQRWREVRARLERRRHARVLRAQFRRDPKAYLRRLEQLLCQPALPF